MTEVEHAILGQPPLPLKDLYVPAVLEILFIGVGALQATNQIARNMRENQISILLEKQMRDVRRAGGGSDIISWVMRPAIPTNSDQSLQITEPDFLFWWGPYPGNKDESLVVEAKRLRGTGASLAGEYVEQGVLRFVQGYYGRGQHFGIMMGYVLVGPLPNALRRVKEAMNSRTVQTREQAEFAQDHSLCADPNTHHSVHLQDGACSPITLVHIFFDFSHS